MRSDRETTKQATDTASAAANKVVTTALAGRIGGIRRSAMVRSGAPIAANTSANNGSAISERV